MPFSNNNAERETLFTVARWYRHAIYLRVRPHPISLFPPAPLSAPSPFRRALRPRPPRPVFLVCHSPNAARESRLTRRDELGPLRKFSRTFGGHHRVTSCCPSALSRDPHQSLREFHPFLPFCPYPFIAEKPITRLPPLRISIC